MEQTSQTLDEFLNESQEPREYKRALVVKMRAEKKSRSEIAQLLNVGVDYVTKWTGIYRRTGVSGLKLAHKGSQGYLGADERVAVIKWLKEQESWDLGALISYVEDEYQVRYKSNQSYYELMQAAGLSWKKNQAVNPKKDLGEIAAKRAEITAYLLAHRAEIMSGRRIVLFVDECHLLWGDLCGYGWGLKGQPNTVPMTNTKSRQTYYGGLDLYTGQMVIKAFDKGNSEGTIAFLDFLQQQFPDQLLTLIWDGATYHTSAAVRTYLTVLNDDLAQEQWLITCIKLAPHAPEQNPIETVWGVAKNLLQKNYHHLPSFAKVKHFFVNAIQDRLFNFKNLVDYQHLAQII